MHVMEGVPLVVARSVLALFLLPGTLVCDAAGIRSGDDRAMIRSLINMLVWNGAAVLVTVTLW